MNTFNENLHHLGWTSDFWSTNELIAYSACQKNSKTFDFTGIIVNGIKCSHENVKLIK